MPGVGRKVSVAVVGPGAVGSLLVYAMNRAGVEPTLVGKGYEQLRKISISMPSGETVEVRYRAAVFSSPDWLGSNVIFIATKAYDASQVIQRIAESPMAPGLVVVVQNGLGVYEEASRILGPGRVAQLVLNHGAHRAGEGLYTYVGGGESYLGMARGYNNELLGIVASMLEILGVRIVGDIEPYRWLKLAVNASINPITAILGVKNRFVAESQYARELARRVSREVSETASKLGIEIPRDPFEEVMEVARRTGDNISSMLSDIMNCKRTEVDYINGAIASLAEEKGVDASTNRLLYSLVKAREEVCRKQRGQS